MKKITYYLVCKRTVAKRKQCEGFYNDYIFKDGKWLPDNEHIIMDHLAEYAPSEPEDSPYRIGGTGILMEMEEISGQDAVEITNRQSISILKDLWKKKIKKEKEEWDKGSKWPAKLVKTRFMLNGIEYTIWPSDIGLSDDPWDQGFMESIQSEIKADLKEFGATDIFNYGFLD